MNNEFWDNLVSKRGGDLEALNIRRFLETLDFTMRQRILASIGECVLSDLVDNTTITPEIVKGHYKLAKRIVLDEPARIPA
jgi:hypothetical protein